MLQTRNSAHNFPTNFPMNFSGKLTYKVILKSDYVRSDGTSAIYVQLFLNKIMKRIPVGRSARAIDFDKKRQRVKATDKFADDTNLIIEKMLADLNRIEVHYRVSNLALTMEKLLDEFENPHSRMDFIAFCESEMVIQKGKLESSTYRQQMTVLNKLKEFRQQLFFYEITTELYDKILLHLKKVRKNEPTTIASFAKTFKKLLRIANKRGIVTPMDWSEIKVGSFLGNRTFLLPGEVANLYKYWNNEFINPTHKAILSRFLFSCFTSLRISDNLALAEENFMGEYIGFTAIKTGKFQRIALGKSAKMFLDETKVASGKFSPEYINRELKFIAKAVGIRKNISFHVARHTFATNYLISGGNVVNLQKVLGHYKIDETMIYVHIVESISDVQIRNMDEILSS